MDIFDLPDQYSVREGRVSVRSSLYLQSRSSTLDLPGTHASVGMLVDWSRASRKHGPLRYADAESEMRPMVQDGRKWNLIVIVSTLASTLAG